MFTVMKQLSKMKPVSLEEEACTELLNYLELLGDKSKCKHIIGSGKLACNCLKVLKSNPNFVEAIGGFIMKWLDKPKVEQDQHLLTSCIYAKAAKKSAGKVPKGTSFIKSLLMVVPVMTKGQTFKVFATITFATMLLLASTVLQESIDNASHPSH